MQFVRFSTRGNHAMVGSALIVVAALFFTVQIQAQNTRAALLQPPATPQAVCAFITARMTSALPQQPTLCAGKQEQAPGYYSISIFSPKNALEGDTRRSWASALFQTLEDMMDDKSLNGACSATPICIISISDAYMTQHNWRYETALAKDSISMLRGKLSPPEEAEFSEHWYVDWWRTLFTFKESDIQGSQENATQIGKRACEDYIAALRTPGSVKSVEEHEDRMVEAGGTVLGTAAYPGGTGIPSCSVMLASKRTIYIALDFPDLVSALFAANNEELPPTFGSWFDNTGYDGQVIIKSPWTNLGGSEFRVYYTFPLRAIEFAYEEERSGLRSEFDGGELLRAEFGADGQMSENTFVEDPKQDSVLRNAALIKFAPEPDDTVIADTTDGAEWRISKESFDHCDLHPGDEIEVSTLLITGDTVSTHGPPTLTTQKGSVLCKLTSTFVRGW